MTSSRSHSCSPRHRPVISFPGFRAAQECEYLGASPRKNPCTDALTPEHRTPGWALLWRAFLKGLPSSVPLPQA